MNDIVSADIVGIIKKLKQFFFGCLVKGRTIMAERADVVDFMITQTDLNVYYGIPCGFKWYRYDFIADGIVYAFSFLGFYESAP